MIDLRQQVWMGILAWNLMDVGVGSEGRDARNNNTKSLPCR